MEATAVPSGGASLDGRSVGSGGVTGTEFLNLGMFSGGSSSSQPGSELLVDGTSGGAFSLGGNNGFGSNNNDSSGINSATGASVSSTPGTSFDLSDFPSLGGTTGGASAASAGNALAAALRQPQILHQQQQQQQQLLGPPGSKVGSSSSGLYRLAMTGTNGNFNMASENFPALSTTSNGPTNDGTIGSSLLGGTNASVGSSTEPTAAPNAASSSGSGLYGDGESDSAQPQLEGAPGLLGNTGLGGLGGLRGLQQQQQPSRSGAVSSSGGSTSGAIGGGGPTVAGSAISGDYGLLGLLGVIRMTDADRNALALGSDLTLLGLNLGSTEQIYGTFSGPWADSSTTKEPHYQVCQIFTFNTVHSPSL